MTMSFNDDPACKILSDEEFLSVYARANEYYQSNPKDPIVAFVEFDFMYPLEDGAELTVYGGIGKAVPYKGKAKKQIRLVFEKEGEVYEEQGVEYFQAHISVRIYDKKRKSICVYSSERGIRLPNLNGGNKFLLKMTHPHDERQPLTSFDIIDLP